MRSMVIGVYGVGTEMVLEMLERSTTSVNLIVEFSQCS